MSMGFENKVYLYKKRIYVTFILSNQNYSHREKNIISYKMLPNVYNTFQVCWV